MCINYTEEGNVSIEDCILFYLHPESCSARDPDPIFTLTCITTGGPASAVLWKRNGLGLANGSDYSMTQTIVNSSEATYKNSLRVSKRWLGNYSISVCNSRSAQPVTSHYNVTGKSCTVEPLYIIQRVS